MAYLHSDREQFRDKVTQKQQTAATIPCYCQEFLTKLDNLHKGVNR